MTRWPKTDPDHIEFAGLEIAKGRSSREIAEDFAKAGVPVTHTTVVRWAKMHAARAKVGSGLPAPLRAEPAPERSGAPAAGLKPNPLAAELAARKAAAPPAPTPAVPLDTVSALRSLLESFMADAARSKEGNPRLAATLAKSAADVLDQIRKIEARQAEDSASIRISRDEIAKAHAAALERFKALCDRPLLCADCGRKLAIAWGEAGEKVADAEKSEGA